MIPFFTQQNLRRGTLAGILLLFPLLLCAQIQADRIVEAPVQPRIGAFGINCQVEDQAGFFWLGTNNGIIRLDGKEQMVYQHHSAEPFSLPGNQISHLDTISGGGLLISTDKGLARFDPGVERFHLVPLGEKGLSRFTQNRFGGNSRLFFDESGWYLSQSPYRSKSLVVEAQPGEQQIFAFQRPDGKFHCLSNLRSFVFDAEHPTQFSLSPAKIEEVFVGGGSVKDVCFIPKLNAWAISNSFGRLHLYDEELNLHPFSDFFKGIDFGNLNDMTMGPDEALWIASLSGLYHFAAPYDSPPTQLIKEYDLYSLLRDQKDGLWLGTSNGWKMVPSLSFQFGFIPLKSQDENAKAIPWGLSVDSKGNLWAGGYGGIHQIPAKDLPQTGPSRFFPKPGVPTNFTSILEFGEGYFVGAPTGIFRFFPETGRFLDFPLRYPSEDRKARRVHFLLENLGDSLIATANYRCLEVFDPETGAVQPDFFPNSRMVSGAICKDNKGKYWMADSIIQAWPGESGLSQNLKQQWINSEASSQSAIFSIFSRNEEEVIVGTSTGIFFLDAVRDTLFYLHELPGWPSPRGMGILGEEEGPVWISSENGLVRFHPETLEFETFSTADGIPRQDYSQFSFLRHPAGRYIFGTNGGLVHFHPDSIPPRNSRLAVNLLDIKVNFQSIREDSLRFPDARPAQMEKLSLKPSERNLSLTFSAPNLVAPEATEYAIILEGWDEDWQIRGAGERIAYYPNLPSGQFIFRVKARSGHGDWGTERALTIFRQAPLTERWWFRILLIVGLLALISTGIFLYFRQKLRKQERLLAEQARLHAERQRISRDLHDNVGSNLTALSLGLQNLSRNTDNPETEAKISSIEDLSRQSIRQLRDSVWALDQAEVSLQDLRKKIFKFLSEFASLSGREIEWEIDCNEPEFLLEANFGLQVYRMLQEGIQNAFKHSGMDELYLSLEMHPGEELRISLRDNGKGLGFDPAKEEIPEGHYGLRNLRTRTASLNGRFELVSEKGKGTELKWFFKELGQLPQQN